MARFLAQCGVDESEWMVVEYTAADKGSVVTTFDGSNAEWDARTFAKALQYVNDQKLYAEFG